MSYVDDLLEAYRKFVSLPWQQNLAPAQRVWMAVYPPDQERRVRLHVPDFELATMEAGYSWALIDITASFEHWMARHEYRDQYFESPKLLEAALPYSNRGDRALFANPDASSSWQPVGVSGVSGHRDEKGVASCFDEHPV